MVNKQTLNGEWHITSLGEREISITGTVPSVIHESLLQHDILPDPFYQDQEQAQRWVGKTDWRYERTFVVDETLLAQDRVLLRCHGLDTIATISINGREIGSTENMYRTYEFDVREALQAGENTISITFTAPLVYSRQQEAEHGVMPTWSVDDHRVDAGSHIRKEPSNFGWDWGPQLVTSGIWRDIELVGFNSGRIQDVQILQEHTDGTVDLTVQLQVERLNDLPQHIEVRLTQGNDYSISLMIPVPEDGKASATVQIPNPRLWWVAGMGEQPLYDLTITLKDGSDAPLDVVEKRIGLRTLRLDRHADEWGESFQFTCNGIPFFAKGANWIPGDVFVARMTRDDYALPLRAAVEANMNMLRVWGGGIYESNDFYDLCDELGLAVWQDFMFACGTYPTTRADFMANVRAEAEDNVRRLRHHASLALWCGNNELEMGLVASQWTEHTMSWDDYGKLFDVLLAEVVQELSPQTDYWPSSPHSPCGDRSDHINEDCGDGHLWAVWHGKQPFEWYRTMNSRFISEFGFQSFPEPRTTNEFTQPEDRNLTSYVMEYHQRSPIGNATILHYMLEWFQMPTSFEMMSWLSQFLQAIGMKYAVEHWRRNMPRSMGTLYWQLNDLWPGPTWSSLDWRGRWKALHYLAKRFYAPVLISGVEQPETGTVAVHITSDAGEEKAGTVKWFATTAAGAVLQEGSQDVTIAPRASACVQTLELQPLLDEHTARNVIVWLELHIDGQIISDNLVTFKRPKHLALQNPQLQATLKTEGDAQFIEFVTDVVAIGVWVEALGEAEFHLSDSFFCLRPGQPYSVQVISETPISESDFAVYSLADTHA